VKRTFDTGATRDTDEGKHDPEAFWSPLVMNAFDAYMHQHRQMADGSLRAGDNWQQGIPLDAYMKSKMRHDRDAWCLHRGLPGPSSNDMTETLCAILFNTMGYLHEHQKAQQVPAFTSAEWDAAAEVVKGKALQNAVTSHLNRK
jgi:hypothetical protein